MKQQNTNLLSPTSNPLLHAFFPQSSDPEATTVLNFNLKPKTGNVLSQPMPTYQLANLFPPSDRFPSQSLNISHGSSADSSPLSSPRARLGSMLFSQPISPSEALNRFSKQLTKWEQTEILNYNEVYCLGLEAEKVKNNQNFMHNFGFDDEYGKYKVVIKDHIAYRYEICEVFGYGAFGVVVKALDVKEYKYVALKIIDAKASMSDEVLILETLKSLDTKGIYGIVDYYGSFKFRKHPVLILEVLSINLYSFLKNSNFEGVSPNLIRRIASQLLNSLCFLHKFRIIHCDLKPENILFKEINRSIIKLADFGTSCFEGEEIFKYIQSRYYRAPEIFLGLSYTNSIDIWSFGCILAELYTGKPIFNGINEIDQLFCIMEYTGPPPDDMILASQKRKLYVDENLNIKAFKNEKGIVRQPLSRTFEGFLSNADPKFVEFVKKCLEIDPRNRITAQQALIDPWLVDINMKIVTKKREPAPRKLSLTAPLRLNNIDK